MNPVSPARRRADAFSSMVDATTLQRDTGRTDRTDKYAADLAPLVGIVTSLRATPAPEARPEFVHDLRSRLMLAAETVLSPDTTVQVVARSQPARRRTSRERRLAVAIGGFAIVSASASMSVAAQSALPGDTLYPLKRAMEHVHEQVARDADSRGATMLDNAEGRLDEVDELSRAGDRDADVISQTLQDFTDQAVEASDVLLDDFASTGRLASIEELRSFTATSLATLKRLEGVVPTEARATLVQAARVIGGIDRQAVSLCPSCGGGPLVDPLLTASGLDPTFDHVLGDSAEVGAATPTKRQEPGGKTADTRPSTDANQAPDRTPTPAAPIEEPAAPALPAPDGSGTAGHPDNPLQAPLTGLHNPLDQLLTGTVDSVTETVEGVLGQPQPKSEGKKK